MARFRAVTLDHRFGPWLPTPELAGQDAVEAGEASRDPFTGQVFLGVGTSIEADPEDMTVDPEMERWANALRMLHDHHEMAIEHVIGEVRASREDPARRDWWQDIGRRISAIMEDAKLAAEKEVPGA